jgi:hypothetical protein
MSTSQIATKKITNMLTQLAAGNKSLREFDIQRKKCRKTPINHLRVSQFNSVKLFYFSIKSKQNPELFFETKSDSSPCLYLYIYTKNTQNISRDCLFFPNLTTYLQKKGGVMRFNYTGYYLGGRIWW